MIDPTGAALARSRHESRVKGHESDGWAERLLLPTGNSQLDNSEEDFHGEHGE